MCVCVGGGGGVACFHGTKMIKEYFVTSARDPVNQMGINFCGAANDNYFYTVQKPCQA